MRKIASLFVAIVAAGSFNLAGCGDDARDCAEGDKGKCNVTLNECSMQCGFAGNAGDCMDDCNADYCNCLADLGCEDSTQCD